ncbi:FkbM family methyltransferase [Parvibaculum sp.]|nr:FkbM family methyltransferase [Parvibaculum sp.]MBX3490551.1 FkbM family methyltransferase [Parvibaculum sp.]
MYALAEFALKLRHHINRFLYHRRRRMLPSIEGDKFAACGQDIFVADLLGGKRNGIFVDIGANDGVTVSNSYRFEKELGWTGVAVEPLPSVFEKLKANRSCHLVNGCVTPEGGKAQLVEIVGAPNMLSTLETHNRGLTARRLRHSRQRHGSATRNIEVDCHTFASLMDRFGIRSIDFLSVDTEGGELDILKSIDFGRYPVSVISVENNFYADDIRNYLEKQGFFYLGTFKVDEIYLFGGAHLRAALSAE